jgi:predicted PhzF superfamily epimerase YddE/YHI9
VDAFANPKKNGTGNPAAVVVLDNDCMIQKQLFATPISSDEDGDCTSISGSNFQHTNLTTSALQWMQLVANEFNLSETAFVWPYHYPTTSSNDNSLDDRNNRHHYYIKYFTPTVEVPLCGHATLASASVMYQTTTKATMSTSGPPGSIYFHTVDDNVVLETHLSSSSDDAGTLEQKQNQQSMNITMNFPTAPVVEITKDADKMEIQQMLSKALRIDVSSILYMGLVPNLDDLLIELAYDSFMELSYDDIQYSAFHDFTGRGIIISCLSNSTESSDLCVSGTNSIDNNDGDTVSSAIDFYSRFFAPKAGIDEDPVTGSAHCALSVYYSNRLNGKSHVIGYQKSKRSGIVSCNIIENGTRVQLTGTAVMAVSGTLWW